MATTISFLRKKSKAKTPLDEDTQLSQDEAKFAMEFLKGKRPRLCICWPVTGRRGEMVSDHTVRLALSLVKWL